MAFLGRAALALLTDRAAGALTIVTGLRPHPPHQRLAAAARPLVIGIVLALVRAGLTDAVLAAGAPQDRRRPGRRRASRRRCCPHAGAWRRSRASGHLAWLGALAAMSSGE